MDMAAVKTRHFIVVCMFYFLRNEAWPLEVAVGSFVWGKAILQTKLSYFHCSWGKNLMQKSNSGTDGANRAALFSEIN